MFLISTHLKLTIDKEIMLTSTCYILCINNQTQCKEEFPLTGFFFVELCRRSRDNEKPDSNLEGAMATSRAVNRQPLNGT